ncbi:abscisic acid receptor PYR1 [Striga asiatica]|uniref:Abscisic acid receptor PYR1 n=1 Tax=Striga asiatica TaxID=4170 RepID=A0A5A7Q8C5_STRAF|nr:abscisic acid receptor PYR1 [Striga asiatica]
MVSPLKDDRRAGGPEEDFIRGHHKHDVGENQCSSSFVKHIKAPLPLVWSLVRIFDQPQRYKPLNYSSIITVHPEIIDGRPGTLVIESFVVDVPEGNTKDETCYFVEALIKCNLKSLADVSEHLAMQGQTDLIERF